MGTDYIISNNFRLTSTTASASNILNWVQTSVLNYDPNGYYTTYTTTPNQWIDTGITLTSEDSITTAGDAPWTRNLTWNGVMGVINEVERAEHSIEKDKDVPIKPSFTYEELFDPKETK